MIRLIDRRAVLLGLTATATMTAIASPAISSGAGTPTIFAFGGGTIGNRPGRAMVAASGRASANTVVVSLGAPDPRREGLSDARWLRGLGARKTTVLGVGKAGRRPVRDLFEQADLIWFTGGYQKRHVLRLNAITGASKALRSVYASGCVIGGVSAGAAVMSRVMISGGSFPNVYTRPGFGLWPGVIIDQHVIARKREWRLQKAIAANPRLVGVGIDEGAGVSYQNGEMQVLGRSAVILVRSVKGQIQETRLRRGQRVRL